MEDITADQTTLCPSARPETKDGIVFGIVSGTIAQPHVAYLKQPQPITNELLAKASPVTPSEISNQTKLITQINIQYNPEFT
jgi:hypothetical protein